MKQKLHRLERRWISSKLEIDKEIFKDSCREYNQMIKQAKQRYHSSQLEGCNSKQLFQKVYKLCTPKISKVLPSDDSDSVLAERFFLPFLLKKLATSKLSK